MPDNLGTEAAAYKRSGSPASMAEELIRQYSSLFGIDSPYELKLDQLEESQIARHFRYRQYLSGLPVDSSEVRLHFDYQNRLIAATSSVPPRATAKTVSFQIVD